MWELTYHVCWVTVYHTLLCMCWIIFHLFLKTPNAQLTKNRTHSYFSSQLLSVRLLWIHPFFFLRILCSIFVTFLHSILAYTWLNIFLFFPDTALERDGRLIFLWYSKMVIKMLLRQIYYVFRVPHSIHIDFITAHSGPSR